MSRGNDWEKRQAATAAATSWGDTWQDTKGGFNPDVFVDVDDVTRQKLLDYQIGPPIQMGDKLNAGSGTLVGHWSDGGNYGFHNNPEMNEAIYGDIYHHGTNRGNVQNAVWEAGFANIGNKDQLNQFLDRADAVKANNPDFLKDGWTPEAQMLMREYPIQEVIQESVPVVADPVEVAETPAVVEQAPAVREPVKGVDYMSSEMQDTYDRIQDQNYHTGFNAEDWIAETSKSDIDKQEHAQSLVDKWTSDIANNLQPNPQSVVNALTTAFSGPNTVIPGKLGVYS